MADDMTSLESGDRFELTRFLAGRTRATGVFEDRFGRLRRRFEVTMDGGWIDGLFRLEEAFVYDDGRREQRVWIVRPRDGGRFEATCEDCIGTARGSSTGDTIRMRYVFRLRLPTRALNVTFDDRLYRLGPGAAMNRATVRKWGIRLGEMSLFFEKLPASMASPDAA